MLKRTGPQLGISAGDYTVVVGAGGPGMGWNPTNTNGQDTVISPPTSPTTYLIRAVGGGAGGYPAYGPTHLQDIKEILVVLVVVLTPNLHPINQPCHLYRKGAVVFLVKEIQVAEIYSIPSGYCQVGGGGGGAGGPGTRGFTDTNNYPTSNYFYGGTGGAGTQVSEFPFTEIFSPELFQNQIFQVIH